MKNKSLNNILMGTFMVCTLAIVTAGIVFKSEKYMAIFAVPTGISVYAMGKRIDAGKVHPDVDGIKYGEIKNHRDPL